MIDGNVHYQAEGMLAEAGELEVIGAHTLESLGLTVDPVQKKLVPIVMALALAVKGEDNG